MKPFLPQKTGIKNFFLEALYLKQTFLILNHHHGSVAVQNPHQNQMWGNLSPQNALKFVAFFY